MVLLSMKAIDLAPTITSSHHRYREIASAFSKMAGMGTRPPS